MKKYISHYKNNTDNTKSKITPFENMDNCMDYTMQNLFLNIGNGDGENGGAGSLWRCAKDIYDSIRRGERYSYADGEWWVEIHDTKDPAKTFLFRFSAVVDNNMTIEAKDYFEAVKIFRKKVEEYANDLTKAVEFSEMGWDYDGNTNMEGADEYEVKEHKPETIHVDANTFYGA